LILECESSRIRACIDDRNPQKPCVNKLNHTANQVMMKWMNSVFISGLAYVKLHVDAETDSW
jgi:hypothetical protein